MIPDSMKQVHLRSRLRRLADGVRVPALPVLSTAIVCAALAALCLASGCHKSAAPEPAASKTVDADAKPDAKSDAAADSKSDAKSDAADDGVPVVKIETARRGAIEKLLPLSGTLTVARDQEAMIAPPVAGILDQFSVHIGDTVRTGQVIAHLSIAPLLGQIQQSRAGMAQYDIAGAQAETAALQQQGQTKAAILQAEAAVSAAHANLLGAQATLTADEAAMANAQQSFSRAKSLFDEGLVAQKDVEAAGLAERTAAAQVEAQKQIIAGLSETLAGQKQSAAAARVSRLQDAVRRKDVDIARAQRANAAGALATTEAQIALYTIRAPIGGVVTAVNGGLGESVDVTTKIATIANLDRLQLSVAVPTGSIGALRVGQPLVFTVDSLPAQTFHANIRIIGTQIDAASSTATVIAEVDNSGHRLKDDMSVHVGLVMAQHRNVVLVPKSAVFFETSGSGDSTGSASVLKIDADSKARKVPVTVGLTEGELIEITSGVKPGDHLASTGGYGLSDGTKVKSADAAEEKPAGKSDDKEPAAK